MNRRRLIATLGAAAGLSGTLGTGAFTSTSAERSVTVEVAEDGQALLSLEDLGRGGRSLSAGQTVAFSFPGEFAPEERGLGINSVYEFEQDSGRNIFGDPGTPSEQGLLEIRNDGTQEVKVFSRDITESAVDIELYDVSDQEEEALRAAPAELQTGESVNVGFRIRTFDVDINTDGLDETLKIIAEAD